MSRWDLLLTDARVATLCGDEGGYGETGYGEIEDGAVAIADGRIAWVGPRTHLPSTRASFTRSVGRNWLTPALIDCHTHLVFAGDRAKEFEQRLEGQELRGHCQRGWRHPVDGACNP